MSVGDVAAIVTEPNVEQPRAKIARARGCRFRLNEYCLARLTNGPHDAQINELRQLFTGPFRCPSQLI